MKTFFVILVCGMTCQSVLAANGSGSRVHNGTQQESNGKPSSDGDPAKAMLKYLELAESGNAGDLKEYSSIKKEFKFQPDDKKTYYRNLFFRIAATALPPVCKAFIKKFKEKVYSEPLREGPAGDNIKQLFLGVMALKAPAEAQTGERKPITLSEDEKKLQKLKGAVNGLSALGWFKTKTGNTAIAGVPFSTILQAIEAPNASTPPLEQFKENEEQKKAIEDVEKALGAIKAPQKAPPLATLVQPGADPASAGPPKSLDISEGDVDKFCDDVRARRLALPDTREHR